MEKSRVKAAIDTTHTEIQAGLCAYNTALSRHDYEGARLISLSIVNLTGAISTLFNLLDD